MRIRKSIYTFQSSLSVQITRTFQPCILLNIKGKRQQGSSINCKGRKILPYSVFRTRTRIQVEISQQCRSKDIRYCPNEMDRTFYWTKCPFLELLPNMSGILCSTMVCSVRNCTSCPIYRKPKEFYQISKRTQFELIVSRNYVYQKCPILLMTLKKIDSAKIR